MKRTLAVLTGLITTAVMTAAVTATGPAHAHPVEGNLPGGTSISVSIDDPDDGALLPTGPVTVTGTAAVGEGEAVPSTAVIYAIDNSGTTARTTGCGGDQDGDGTPDEVLDCMIAAAKDFNDQALSPGVAGTITEVGAVAFADGAVKADVQPGAGVQLITGPDSDLDGVGGRDIEQVLSSTFNFMGSQSDPAGFGEFTFMSVGCCTSSWEAGVRAATEVAAAAGPGFRKLVLFMAEDFANASDDITAALAEVPEEVDFYTFAIGPTSQCTAARNSLQEIADTTGGTCTEVFDLNDLPDVLPDVIGSELTSLTLQVDGGPAVPITNVTPSLPQDGPASVDYTVTTGPLSPGVHDLCVTAHGNDGGGTGSVTDCHQVVIHAPGEAFAIQASGLVTIPKTPHATCPPDESHTLAQLSVGIATVTALTADCTVDPATGETVAEASVDGASLLGGLITITDIESSCVANAGGITRSSSVGTINGTPIGLGSGSLTIPLVATVHFNETTTNAQGQAVQNAIRVQTILGQQIILAGCRLG